MKFGVNSPIKLILIVYCPLKVVARLMNRKFKSLVTEWPFSDKKTNKVDFYYRICNIYTNLAHKEVIFHYKNQFICL